MPVSKLPFLLALCGATGSSFIGAAQAQAINPIPQGNLIPQRSQRLNAIPAPPRNYTTVDANGNVVRATIGGGTVDNDRRRPRHNGDKKDRVYYGGGYYVPPAPYPYGGYPYGYPQGGPVYNNYYPALPSTTVLGTPAYSWSRPTTITSIPLGNYAYPNPGYPAYPGYPVPLPHYPSYPGYPYPNYGYPTAPYPTYGSTTIYGAGTGTIYSQSQTGGYGLSLGNGGLSVQLGNRQSSSTTTVTTR